MQRLDRSPRAVSTHPRSWKRVLLLSALTLVGTACDRDGGGGPLGPLDAERVENFDHTQELVEAERPYVAPVDLELDWALANALVPAERGSELVARIRVEAPEELALPRPPARVVLVVDTSASMKGDAIEGAKAAAIELVDSLSDGDSFSLVVFHSRAETLMSATLIGANSRTAAKAEIEKMQAWGTTDLAGGMREALGQLAAAPISMATPEPETGAGVQAGAGVWVNNGPDPQVLERVVLLGDGVPNDPAPIAALTQEFAARGAEITALGYGLEYDEVLLASLAEATHGHFRFVEEPDAVAALFRDELLHIQRTVARDLRLGMGLGPGVSLIEVVGHTVQWNAQLGHNEIVLGSISEGQTQELIVRLAVGPHSEGATVELSDLELSFTDVYTGTGSRFERSFLSVRASADDQAIDAGRDLDIARAGARARTDAATLQVLALARAGQLDESKARMAEAVKWAKNTAKTLEDEVLRAQAERLAALEPELRSLARQARRAVSTASVAFDHGPSRPPSKGGAPQPFPAQPSAAGARSVKAAHNDAYNNLHN
ncbi:von Willebrand factor type A domain protein [Enhygromyxa salina]|uniref:von Willebrand factor type A domain protein n=1 Tax=Enhygromyxa salina TaxID=215803 RepID=A0A2S9Y7F0_9BACT|nr:VWA domain-containing protein [Enhygromyxa salina]PRQ01017.1 von Willebrand factor type A domain protein [Enhygromyxa salina]